MQASADETRRVPRSQHAHVIATGYELLRQRLDMPVYAALVGPGIGRDKRNAHGVRVPRSLVVLGGVGHTSLTYPCGAAGLRGELLNLACPRPGERQERAQRE